MTEETPPPEADAPEAEPIAAAEPAPGGLQAFKLSKVYRARIWIGVCGLLGCLLSFWAAEFVADFLHFEHLSVNVRASLFSDRPATQSHDVSIVAIDDRELANLPYYSPLDRGYIADVLQTVAQYHPRRIVLDLVFDRHSDPAKDDRLLQVLKTLPVPVVLAYADQRTPGEDTAYEQAFIQATGRPYGYANLLEQTEEQPGDFEVTDIPRSVTGHCSLSAMVADTACREPERESRPIDWLLRPKDGTPNFATLRPRDIPKPTNADTQAFARDDCDHPGAAKPNDTPLMTDIAVRLAATDLHCRVVLLGGILSYEDQHKTPIGNLGDFTGAEDRQTTEATAATHMTGDIPGLLIQAFAAQQLFDGRILHDFDPVTTALLVLIAGLLGAAAVEMEFAEKHPRFFILLCSLGFMGIDIVIYKVSRHIFPGNLVIVAFALALFLNLLRIKSSEERVETEIKAGAHADEDPQDAPEPKPHGFLKRIFHGVSHIVMELMG